MRGCLGRGGHGEVYRATMGREGGVVTEVAVKVLAQDVDPNSDPVFRLKDEGRLLGALNHPVILKVFDLVVLEGRAALVTEYIEGQDLHRCIYEPDATGRVPSIPTRALIEIVGHLAEALHAAWTTPSPYGGGPMRLVHRDIKPQNIRIGVHGQVKLLDFGIARATNVARESQTQGNVLMGSWPYLAPERMVDNPAHPTPAVDVYGLGCVLFEVLAHERLMEHKNLFELYRLVDEPGQFGALIDERLSSLVSAHPTPVLSLLDQLLAEDPGQRPTATEVAQACEELAEQLPGVGVRRWAKLRQWPQSTTKPGPLTDRDLTEGTLSFNRDRKGDNADPAPLDEPALVLPQRPVDPAAATVLHWHEGGEDDEDEPMMPDISSIVIDGPEEPPAGSRGGAGLGLGLAVVLLGGVLLGGGLLVAAGAGLFLYMGESTSSEELIPAVTGDGPIEGTPTEAPEAPGDPQPEAEAPEARAPEAEAPEARAPAAQAPRPRPAPTRAAPAPAPEPSPVIVVAAEPEPSPPAPEAPQPEEPAAEATEEPAAEDPTAEAAEEPAAEEPVAEAAEEPTEAPEPTDPPAPEVTADTPGRLVVEGDAVVELRGEFGGFRAGTPLLPGGYEVWADLGAGMASTGLKTEAEPGGKVTVSCSKVAGRCFVTPLR